MDDRRYTIDELLTDTNFRALPPEAVEEFINKHSDAPAPAPVPTAPSNVRPPDQLIFISSDRIEHSIDRETTFISPQMDRLFLNGEGRINLQVKSEIVDILVRYLKYRKKREADPQFRDPFAIEKEKWLLVLMIACQLDC